MTESIKPTESIESTEARNSYYVQVVEDNIDNLLSQVDEARVHLKQDLLMANPDLSFEKYSLREYIDNGAFDDYHQDNKNPDAIVNYRVALDRTMTDLKDSIECSMNSMDANIAKVRLLQIEIQSLNLDIKCQKRQVDRDVTILKECLVLLSSFKANPNANI